MYHKQQCPQHEPSLSLSPYISCLHLSVLSDRKSEIIYWIFLFSYPVILTMQMMYTYWCKLVWVEYVVCSPYLICMTLTWTIKSTLIGSFSCSLCNRSFFSFFVHARHILVFGSLRSSLTQAGFSPSLLVISKVISHSPRGTEWDRNKT